MKPDKYIIIEGGIVQNNPGLPVFDLDVFQEGDWDQIADMRIKAFDHGALEIVDLIDSARESEGLPPFIGEEA